MSPMPIAIVIYIYIYITPLSSLSRVHSEFTTLFIRWPEKFEKGGGEVLILFFFNGLHLEGKSMSLLKFFVVV
jgi:hypothetical protein